MDVWHDVRYAVRRLVQARWFTLSAVFALSLGIGANATVFTFVNAVLLRGLPFDDPDRIMAVWTENERGQAMGVSLPDYEDLRDESRTLESLAGYLGSDVNISDGDRLPEQVSGAYVTGNLFRMLHTEPVLGRGFTDEDDQPSSEPVVVLSYSVWQNRYGGDQDVVGLPIRVNSLPATVVGVMPLNMQFPFNNDIWIPQVHVSPTTRAEYLNRGIRNYTVAGRLAPGVSVEQAREELQALGRRLAGEYPETNANRIPNILPFQERTSNGELRLIFLSLMGAVVFVLLIACANVANLLLAKSAERAREIAVRVSLGATRSRIVRQLLIESVLVAALAGVLGLAFAVLGIRWFDSVTQEVGKPYWMVFSMDPIVFGFLAAVCLGTALLFGLAPALHVSRTDVTEVLKEGARGGTAGMRARRWTGALIVGEIALTLILLSGAGFMMRSFSKLYRLDHGIETDGLLTMSIYLPRTKYPEPAGQLEIYEALLDRLHGLPALSSSALVNAFPLSGGFGGGLELDGSAAEPGQTRPIVTSLVVSDDYFDAIGVEVVRGRTFTAEDGLPGSEVAIVNQRFVDLHLGDGDPLGRRIRLVQGQAADPEGPWLTVVGVAPTVRQRDIAAQEPDPVVYAPLRSAPVRPINLMVRAQGDPAEVTSLLRRTMQSVEPDVPLYNIMTMEERLAQVRWSYRVIGSMFAVFAAIALLLSAVGLYSVTAHSVVQRVREFGIRLSLGAREREISWLALRRMLGYLALGLPLGGAGAFGVGRLLQGLLAQTSPTDPITLAGIVLLMVSIAVLACLWPARRAARIDPMAALRVE